MFKKKPTEEPLTTTQQETRKSVLKDKDDNYKFLLLVRDQQYQEAYRLGRAIIKVNPDNPSIAKFCLFIEQNNAQLKKMVDEEREEAEYSTDSEESGEEEDGEDEQEEDEGSEFSDSVVSESQSESEREKSSEKKKERSPQRLCDVHEWPHICKNPDCPNKRPK